MTFSPVQTCSPAAPPAISSLLQTLETLLSRLTLPRMNAFSRCLLLALSTHPEIQGCSPPPHPCSIMTRTSHHLPSLLAESAHRLRPFTQPFFHPLPLTRPTLPHPARPATFLHTTTWLSFKREGAPSLLQHNRSFLPLWLYPPVTTAHSLPHGKPGKATPAPTHSYINIFCSTVLYCLFWLLKDRPETEERWVSMEEGCGWWRERLFVAFSWRRPAVLLSTNCHQSCWKSLYFL